MTGFVELDAMTNFTFLEGGSHPEEMVVQAKAIGLAAIGVADRNSLAGVVRAYRASRKHAFPILVGCRLTFRDGAELIVYPRDRAAYGRLCRLLSLGKSRIEEPPFPLEGEGAGMGVNAPVFSQRARKKRSETSQISPNLLCTHPHPRPFPPRWGRGKSSPRTKPALISRMRWRLAKG